MELDAQPRPARRLEERARLAHRVDARLAEDVGEGREPLVRHPGQHLMDEQAEVLATLFRASPVLEGDLVGPEPGRHEAHRQGGGEAPDDAQRLELVLHRQSVARLHLERRRAVGGEPAEAREGERKQLGLGTPSQVAHGGVDAAATPGDLHVAHAGGPQLLLLVARPAEDGVGVRVHEARREDAAAAVHAIGVGELALEPVARPDGDDPFPRDRHRRAGEHAGVPHLGAPAGARRSGAGDDLARPDEEEPAAAHAITSRTRERRSGACASPRQA